MKIYCTIVCYWYYYSLVSIGLWLWLAYAITSNRPGPSQGQGQDLATGPCGRGHLALALLTIIKRDRYASAPVVDRQVNGVSLTSQASKIDSSGLKVSILP